MGCFLLTLLFVGGLIGCGVVLAVASLLRGFVACLWFLCGGGRD